MLVSVCICACNEEDNIAKLIMALQNQCLKEVEIDEIIVVSASTDFTNIIVRQLGYSDSRIKLVEEKKRLGKASAVNTFINMAKNDICVMISADVIPNYDCVEKLCLPFKDYMVGMTGSRSIPTNGRNGIVGFAGYIQWEMAHRLSLKNPKLGECIAFRKIPELVDPIKALDVKTAVDEAYLEYRLTSIGYELVYVNDSVIYNRSSETLSDLVIQRRRIHSGHLHLKKTRGYQVASLNMENKGRLALEIYWEYVRGMLFMPVVVAIEVGCIGLGMLDFYVLKKNPYIWKISKSTKNIVVNEEKIKQEVY